MPQQPTGPACGNNPNYRMSDGDRQAVAEFRAYLDARGQEKASTEPERTATAHAEATFLAALDAKARELKARERAEHRAAVLRDAADAITAMRREFVEGGLNPAYPTALEQRALIDAEMKLRRMADEAQPATEAKPVTPMTAYLATPCDACRHTLSWHRNDVGCTVALCVCGSFQAPVEELPQ
ncbi:hypothetical protein ACIG0D_01800 [Streptomyces sp. NPDC052773]|uniref:hypothetical protein n=1 Tax=Streptomyces sp. NPDC052773 TaxID=3365693 RepID=UPI0037D670D2